ncbi:MAG TPA: hypothetical protein P5555_14270 [Candidatus Paceibacterota bacterium]|nr:hypothetical protein [Verrucomicrobiota bacterium]HRZ46351.1 hypothetical protein [Candidatus Paceibacterota bacterium]
MNHQQAKDHLFDTTFLIGSWRRRKALEFLFQQGDAKAVRILVDAVDRKQPESRAIESYLGGLTDPGAVEALIQEWTQKERPWLGPVAVDRALAAGMGDRLPMDRATAWLVVSRLESGGDIAGAAEAYVGRAIQEKPPFLQALVFKAGWGNKLELNRLAVSGALELLEDPDADVQTGAQAWLKALPNTQQWNDPIVDAWIRTQTPFLSSLVAAPRLPSNPAKEALLHLASRNVAGYRKLEDQDGSLLAEALAMASPELRKTINEVVLEAKDGALADAYRRSTGAGAEADPQIALRALIASGNEDALFDAARGMKLAEVLPLCRHWAETGRRPKNPRYGEIVDRAAAAIGQMPEVEIEPAPPLPEGFVDLIEQWQSETVTDAQIRQDLESSDPFVRARAILLGGQQGILDDKAIGERASSEHWPERMAVVLHAGHASEKADPVQWINECAGADYDLMGSRIQCGPEELDRVQALCAALRNKKGALAARNLALAEILASFRSLSGGAIRVFEDDSAHQKGATHVSDQDVRKEDLKF